ncbi:hypothetical protein F511_34007 [Dorcoceras hygrometricum]|uniref:Uncharacterized protein n=1 Tax=Dorcoceras hygrometricum TaxID=472368 RepID=A0A2Z7B297_9LAMI|nr:hypothetical protein F511_34007 [Dorcoceras hygrometricum]
MAASFSVNAMRVDFAYVLAMDHAGMVRMFKSLEDTGLKVFLEASNAMYEGAVTEFFVNAKVIAGTIISFVANRKMVLTKDAFATAFGFPTEGMVGFLDIWKETAVEMRMWFSKSDVLFRAPSKKREMKMEFRLLHDIVAKALCAKARSFDMVTSEKFDLMVAITAGLKSMVVSKIVEAGSHIAPVNSTSETSSDEESHPLSSANQKKQRTQRQKLKQTSGDRVDSQPGPIPEIPAGDDEGSIVGGPEPTLATPPDLEKQAGDGSSTRAQDEHMDPTHEMEEWVDGAASNAAHSSSRSSGFHPSIHSDSMRFNPDSNPSSSEIPTISASLTVQNKNNVKNMGPNPNSEENNMDHQGPNPSMMQMVVYTEQRYENNSQIKAKPITQASPDPIGHKTIQIVDHTYKELTSLQDNVSSLGKKISRISDDTNLTRHHNTQPSQQHIVDEVAPLKSQVAEMVECLRELRDAKRGSKPSIVTVHSNPSPVDFRRFSAVVWSEIGGAELVLSTSFD